MAVSYTFDSELWRYREEGGWHFVTLPESVATEIREESPPLRRGFGSLKVVASISGHQWSTSIFPDSKTNSYLLPVKKSVRTAAGVIEGDVVEVVLEVLDLD
ncbi:DUF1905 domain-containing protein [Arthrobacter sp. M4]|uniref:DUF1905 domain-containing protein n=1 Tax=Arthrobacter sp. M4 TaxID=218160 RepID=UPI001CDCA1C6|nr:DUF1905 domain-containing protein [Arthrobacter sp. M4]MCA4133779.1 DUF1905 domain-containing protein [Arthrobacter sp. M4]